ncbi:hypothetical protein EXIGLDRAFT_701689 [Exidia glandulosa HHB12029]|uniref:F-box domain-containing protein n=1 Tax=Exidia glandulosa HHB12029 TaxID=1314781 RepID=A0A165Q5W4_EXIGL|nr:hypothetical protein EXIGLDRAFT_701689 [Exidia glandulosa HHB12029]
MCSKRVKIDDDNEDSGSSGTERHNSHLCRAKLPPETWSEIWLLLACLEDRIAVSHVCSEWRTMALADHRLWGHIAVRLDLLVTWRIRDWDEYARLGEEENRVAARWLRLAEHALERAGRTVSLDICIDHNGMTKDWITRFCALINKHAPRVVRFSLKLGCLVGLRECLRGFQSPMPNVRVLGLNALTFWPMPAGEIPFELFPNVEVFKSRPCDFENFDVPSTGLSKTIRSIRSNAATSASLCALLRAFTEPEHFAIRIAYTNPREDPEKEDLDYVQSRFEKLDQLELTFDWNCYAKTRRAMPRAASKPPYFSIGLHFTLNYAKNPEEEACMAIEDVFCDVVHATPIMLTLEQCEPPWKDLTDWDRKPIRIIVHDPATGQTRQLALHFRMLYHSPKSMQLLVEQLARSPISSLTVPWDLMNPLTAQLKEENLRTITDLTLIVTQLIKKDQNLLWPVLPGLQHVTLKVNYNPEAACDSPYFRLSFDVFRGALEKLVPPPAKLHTLSLHHIRTGGCKHEDWNSAQSLATRVYGLRILSAEEAGSSTWNSDCEYCW